MRGMAPGGTELIDKPLRLRLPAIRMNRLASAISCIAVSLWLAGPTGAAAPLATPLTQLVSGETTQIDLRLVLPTLTLPLERIDLPDGWNAETEDWRLNLWAGADSPVLKTVRLVDLDGNTADLPVHVTRLPLHIYMYRSPAGPTPGQVFVAGSFNGWSGSASPLSDPDGDGVYTRVERLLPGKYFYKFVVDGNWIKDPDNPNFTQDGYQNSILDLGDAAAAPPRLVPWTREVPPVRVVDGEVDQYGLVFRVVGEGGLDPDNLLILLDGRPLESGYTYRHPELTVQVMPNYRTLRIESLSTAGARLAPIFLDNRKSGESRDDVMYFAMTDRFYDGDTANNQPVSDPDLTLDANYNGGDFAGITQKIEEGYFDRLGVSMLWISPANDQPDTAIKDSLPPHKKFTGYHGYWPVHAERTEPRYGSMEDLRKLVETAHSHRIRVIFDFVANHVHEDHPFFRNHPDWFGAVTLPDGTKNIRKWENPFTTWFDDFLPDIDYDKDTPVEIMAANAHWWLDQTGADGFRLDAVKHVPPRFWLRLRRAMGERPVYLVGETIDSRKTIMQFVGPGALDGQFDFPLHWPIREVFAHGRGSFADIESAVAENEREYDPTAIHSTLVGNHDVARFLCYADGDPEVGETVQVDHPSSYKKLVLALTFLMTQPGVPMLYYGDEIGLTGGKDPDNRRMMRFGEDVSPEGRTLLSTLEKLSAARRAHPALRRGSRRPVHVSGESYAYLRTYFDDRLLVAFNRSADTLTLDLVVQPEFGEGALTGLIGGAAAEVSPAGLVRVTLPPQTAEIWIEKK